MINEHFVWISTSRFILALSLLNCANSQLTNTFDIGWACIFHIIDRFPLCSRRSRLGRDYFLTVLTITTRSLYFLQRITIKEIKSHPWFLKNLPRELTDTAQAAYYRRENPTYSLQSVEEIMKIVDEAKVPPSASRSIGSFGWGGEEEDKEEDVEEEEEDDDEYDKQVKAVHASAEVHLI